MASLAFLFAVLAFVGTLGATRAIAAAAKRQARIEDKIDLILENLGLTYDPLANPDAQVVELIRSGQMIQAIRRYREISGTDLEDAKAYVDGLAARLGGRPAKV